MSRYSLFCVDKKCERTYHSVSVDLCQSCFSVISLFGELFSVSLSDAGGDNNENDGTDSTSPSMAAQIFSESF